MRYLKQSAIISCVTALVTIASFLLGSVVSAQFPTILCADAAAQCQSQNTWFVPVDFIVGQITLFGWPVLLGVILAIWHFRSGIIFRKRLASLLVATPIYLGLMILFEVAWYQPWVTTLTPAGHTYSAYELNAVYGSLFVVPIVLFILFWYSIVTCFFLWRKPGHLASRQA